ncbi:MAG: hypothetical protein FWE09_03405 [Treponema sp.]|nr:hypothetical protein [Treponema sp.]
MTRSFLQAHVARDEDDESESYGLGVYRYESGDTLFYFALGGDFGVDFFTAFFPRTGIVASALGNTDADTFTLLDELAGALA